MVDASKMQPVAAFRPDVSNHMSMLRHLQMQARRLDQWPDPKGAMAHSDQSELLSVARSVLLLMQATQITTATSATASTRVQEDSTSSFNLSQSQKEKEDQKKQQRTQDSCLKAACLAVRKKLDSFVVSFAVREFVSNLLYLSVMAESKNAEQRAVGDKGQLAEIVYQICGLRDDLQEKQPLHTSADSRSWEPCAQCKCCHITIQEALSLLQVLHKSLSSKKASENLECPPFEQIPKHVEDGIILLLQILTQISSQVHEACYLAAHRASSQLRWRNLYEDIRQSCFCGVSWPHLRRWKFFEGSLESMEISFAKLERRVALMELQQQRIRQRSARCQTLCCWGRFWFVSWEGVDENDSKTYSRHK